MVFPVGKAWRLLSREHRRAAVVLLGQMVVGSALETLGIGLVIPLIALIADPAFATRHPDLARRIGGGSAEQATIVVNAMVLLVVVYVLRTAFLAYSTWRQNHFGLVTTADLSRRLFAQYLRQPYAFHLERNSALLINNVNSEVGLFATNIVRSGLQLLTETMTLAFVIGLILAVEPLGALIVAATTGIASGAFYYLSKPYIARWGRARQLHAGERVKHLQQGLGGVKDVKILGRERDFLHLFDVETGHYARVGGLQNTLIDMPRLWLELVAIVGLAALVLTMVQQGKTVQSVLPTLGLFAAAAFRMMPGINRVLNALQSIKFAGPVVDVLSREMAQEAPPPVAAQPMSFHREVAMSGVRFRYATAESDVLRGVDLVIPHGTMVGIIGESGAGKSTFVDVLLGLLPPGSGRITVDGVDIGTNLGGWQRMIGYVPQSIFLTDDTLRRNVAFGLADAEIDDAAVARAIRAAQLDDFVRSLPEGLESMVGERGVRISGGQRQRIGIARALYHDPAVLVLDEATSSLDPATEREVMKAVQALHGAKTIVIVSHRLSTVEQCDAVYRAQGGTLASTRITPAAEPTAAGTTH